MASQKIQYIYDANGTKLRKYFYEDNRLMETTDYSGLFVYKDDHLDYILTAEGRIKWDDHVNQSYPEYFIKDHLGNVRSVITSNPNTHYLVQGTDYYPFGMEIPVYGASDNQIKYNSKELQTEADLTWYDYGARFYDPVLGRWHSVDPLAETSRRWSPYTYCMNNPIRFIDPDGMGVEEYYSKDMKRYQGEEVDEFEVYKDGQIVQVPKEGEDKIIIMDNNNQRTDITVNIGENANLREISNGDQTIEILEINDQDKAKEAYKTITKNSTSEFAIINFCDPNDNSKSAIVTGCNPKSVPASGIAKSVYDVGGNSTKEIIHDHPNNSLPSGFDNGTGEVKMPLGHDAKIANDYPKNSNGESIMRAVYKPDFGTINRYNEKSVYHEEPY